MFWQKKNELQDKRRLPAVSLPASQPDKLAIRRLLYSLMTSRPTWANQQWDFIARISQAGNIYPGRRVWWRTSKWPDDPSDWEPGYICLDPGEFRVERPTGAGDIVLDPPVSSERHLLSPILDQQIQAITPEMLRSDKGLHQLKNYAETVLRDMKTNTYLEVLAEFRQEEHRLQTGQAASAQEAVNRLYENCFLNFRMPGITFGPAMALLQIEMGCNLWAVADASAEPMAVLRAFLNTPQGNERSIQEAGVVIGNSHFEDGEKHLQEALDSVTLDKFYQQLFLAAHHFSTSQFIATCVEGRISSDALRYTSLIAEEGFCCVFAGLYNDINNFATGRKEGFKEQQVNLLKSGDEPAARRLLKNYTRPTNPILPRHYARVGAAQAMIQVGGPWLQQGVQELHVLEKEIYDRDLLREDPYEALDRVHVGLMNGYRNSGNDEKASQYAAQVAGRMIMRQALGL